MLSITASACCLWPSVMLSICTSRRRRAASPWPSRTASFCRLTRYFSASARCRLVASATCSPDSCSLFSSSAASRAARLKPAASPRMSILTPSVMRPLPLLQHRQLDRLQQFQRRFNRPAPLPNNGDRRVVVEPDGPVHVATPLCLDAPPQFPDFALPLQGGGQVIRMRLPSRLSHRRQVFRPAAGLPAGVGR